jgi:transcriptional regulator with XRE-family HTH domain
MKLAAWRKREGLSTHSAARRLKLKGGGAQIIKYERGRVPEPAQMLLIIAGTGGDVTANDFHPKVTEVQA